MNLSYKLDYLNRFIEVEFSKYLAFFNKDFNKITTLFVLQLVNASRVDNVISITTNLLCPYSDCSSLYYKH